MDDVQLKIIRFSIDCVLSWMVEMELKTPNCHNVIQRLILWNLDAVFLKSLVSGLPVDVLEQVDGLGGQKIFFVVEVHLVRGAGPHVSPTFG